MVGEHGRQPDSGTMVDDERPTTTMTDIPWQHNNEMDRDDNNDMQKDSHLGLQKDNGIAKAHVWQDELEKQR